MNLRAEFWFWWYEFVDWFRYRMGRDTEYDWETDVRSWESSTGQTLRGVHSEEDCDGRACCIHNPSDHHMRDWPQHYRFDRQLMERICPHGIGHPDPDDVSYQYSIGADVYISVHGCDGCCKPRVGIKRSV